MMHSLSHVPHEIAPPPTPLDLVSGRRAFIRALGLGAMGTAIMAAAGGGPVQAQTLTDTDILNFALNFEYLGAEFYLRASIGSGLTDAEVQGTGTLGPVSGGRQVGFATDFLRNFANELAVDERGHTNTLRQALGSAAIARPAIDLGAAFSQAAFAAGLIPAGGTFDAFANENNFLQAAFIFEDVCVTALTSNENNFLQAAFIFEDVCVTALTGAAPLLTNKANLATAAGFLSVESYQAGAIRLFLTSRGLGAAGNAISASRDTVDGPGTQDQGTLINNLPNISPTDATGLAYFRTPQQVLRVAYLNPNGTPAGFFPNGVNGTIR